LLRLLLVINHAGHGSRGFVLRQAVCGTGRGFQNFGGRNLSGVPQPRCRPNPKSRVSAPPRSLRFDRFRFVSLARHSTSAELSAAKQLASRTAQRTGSLGAYEGAAPAHTHTYPGLPTHSV
jgi:hypothetical protein